MGLSASMWGSVSGLLMHGEKMNVVGNNIANISTIGFKGQRMDFEDYIYQNSFSAGGPTQIGRGVGISAVMGDFSQASFETTNDPTDLAIAGKGFFQVKDPYSSQVWYTRAGNLRFDKEGVLRNPQGLALQGWEIDNSSGPSIGTGAGNVSNAKSPLRGTGVPEDVRFKSWTVEPKQTSHIDMYANLNNSAGVDKSADPNNPFFSVFGSWNGKQPADPPNTAPISEDSYTYHATMQVFDEGGTAHTLSTYFDPVDKTKVKNLPGGYQMFEYMVTMDPKEDMRTYGGKYNPLTGLMEDDLTTYGAPNKPTSIATAGTPLNANSWTAPPTTTAAAIADIQRITGAVPALTPNDVSIVKYPSGGWYVNPNDPNVLKALASPALDPADRATLISLTTPDLPPGAPAAADANTVKKFSDSKSAGVLMMGTMIFNTAGQLVDQTAYTFKGSTILGENDTYNFNPDDLGNWEPTPVSSSGYPVFTPNFTGQPLANSVHQKASANSINQNDAERYLVEMNFGFKSQNLVNPWKSGANAAQVGTDYSQLAVMTSGKREANASTVNAGGNGHSSIQNGYTFGNLNNYDVDKDGVLYGIYDNGVQLPLYQIAIFDFVNTQGLRREGGNLFSATMESGNPRVSTAGQNGMGEVKGYSVEQSNVDMAREFVQMISTQRGFQANSKGITTVDAMLETVIGMKR